MKCWCGGEVARQGDSGILMCTASGFHQWDATGDPDRITRIYVAGPMTGYPDCNYPEFNRVAEQLRSFGYEVVNPAEFGNGKHYVDFLREDLKLLLDCHAVATLENWWLSVGARNEVHVAGLLRMPVRPAVEWLVRARQELSRT